MRMRGRGAGHGTARAEITIRRTEGTRAMSGSVSFGMVTAHPGLFEAESSVVA